MKLFPVLGNTPATTDSKNRPIECAAISSTLNTSMPTKQRRDLDLQKEREKITQLRCGKFIP